MTNHEASQYVLDDTRRVLYETLGLVEGRVNLTPDTPLFGSLPELDSMAVVSLVTALEQHFGITIEDEDITVELFENLRSLSAYVQQRGAQSGS